MQSRIFVIHKFFKVNDIDYLFEFSYYHFERTNNQYFVLKISKNNQEYIPVEFEYRSIEEMKVFFKNAFPELETDIFEKCEIIVKEYFDTKNGLEGFAVYS